MIDISKGVVVFSSDYCPFCVRAKQLFQKKNISFEEARVDGNSGLKQQMIEAAGRTSVPQIWIHGEHVGGCDDLFALEKSGKLDDMLAQP